MPIDDVIGNYVIRIHETLLAYKTLIVAFLITKFILSDPKMILHKFENFGRGDATHIPKLPWQPFPVNEFLVTQEPNVLQ